MNAALYRLLAEYPLEKLLHTIPTGLFLVDTDRKIVYWNSEAERITGYSADETIGKNCSFLEGEPCHKRCGLFSDASNKPVIGQICTFRDRQGKDITLTKNIDLLRDARGRVIGGIEAFVEITRFKQEESLLREAVMARTKELEVEKAALSSVLDGMTDPVYICDKNYRLVFVNQAMHDILGEVSSEHCYEAIYRKTKVCENCPMPEVLKGRVVRQEKIFQGDARTYEVIHSPHPFKKEPTQKLSVCRDITERIETERRLYQTNKELDAFVSTVSHDLRSPLTPLIGFADLLANRYSDQLDDIGRISISEIRKTAEKMRNLLEDLLTLSRVEQLKLPEQQIDVTSVANEMLLELADKVLESGAEVTIAELPALRIPEELIANMFRNLLANAIKYAAGSHPLIEVRGYEFRDRLRYSVIDHGPGIEEDERQTVFEPFFRGRHSRSASGTGIGLATVAKIARVYGGNAWVEETEGGGATFIVDFPIEKKVPGVERV